MSKTKIEWADAPALLQFLWWEGACQTPYCGREATEFFFPADKGAHLCQACDNAARHWYQAAKLDGRVWAEMPGQLAT